MEDDRSELDLVVSSRATIRRLFVALVAAELALVLLDWAINYRRWVEAEAIQRLFNMGREDSLPNYLASLQLLAVAAVVWILFLHARRASPPWVRTGWLVVACAFAYLGVDDGARIHERVGTTIGDGFGFFPSYAWQVIFVPLFGALAVLAALLLSREIRSGSLRVLLGLALLCWVTAVGLDHVEGREVYEELAVDWELGEYTVTHYGRVIEETLENFGTTLFLVVFLRHLFARTRRISVSFSP